MLVTLFHTDICISNVCVFTWYFRFCFDFNNFPQTSHVNTLLLLKTSLILGDFSESINTYQVNHWEVHALNQFCQLLLQVLHQVLKLLPQDLLHYFKIFKYLHHRIWKFYLSSVQINITLIHFIVLSSPCRISLVTIYIWRWRPFKWWFLREFANCLFVKISLHSHHIQRNQWEHVFWCVLLNENCY